MTDGSVKLINKTIQYRIVFDGSTAYNGVAFVQLDIFKNILVSFDTVVA